MPNTTDFDVAIIGGGPAGLSAGLWLTRYLRKVVIVDSGDPRNWETRGINGIISRQGITPPEIRGKARDECRSYGAMLIDDEVTHVERDSKDLFTLDLKSGRKDVTAKRLLLAIGIKDVWPDIPGLEHCYGETAHVCPDCDGYEARDKKTVVIGSGKKAVGIALALRTWTREIVICTNGEKADMTQDLMDKLDPLNIPVLEAKIARITNTAGKVSGLVLEGGMQLDWERIFFALGQYPADDLGAKLGCKRDDIGRIVIDEHYHTSIKNVYAAGDIIHGPQVAVAAMAGGAIAAIAIHNSLKPDSMKID
jgi:thioredoxin reductase